MIKISYSTDQESLLRDCGNLFTLVDSPSMIKRASTSGITREMLQDLKPDKDHFLVHYVALGDHEHYGFNRNADTFTKEACQKYHHTFVKNGHFFKEHNHYSPKLAIGQIKASAYNEDMGRVEVAVWAHKKKAASLLEKIKNGVDPTSSMGCKIAFDRDSCTGKLSPDPSHYEPHMKNSPGQWVEEFKKYAFVYNDDPNWFDLSDVKKPADRIALYIRYQGLPEDSYTKVASAESGIIIPGAVMGELLWGNRESMNSEYTKIANLFLEAEEQFEDLLSEENTSDESIFVKNACLNSFDPSDTLEDSDFSTLQRLRPESVFYKLANSGIVLPFKDWLKYTQDMSDEELNSNDTVKYATTILLPKGFKLLSENPVDPKPYEGGRYSAENDGANCSEIDKLMRRAADKFGVSEEPLCKRVISITIMCSSSPKIKSASDCSFEPSDKQIEEAQQWVRHYCAYKCAAAKQISEIHNKKLDKNMVMLLTTQNKI